MTQAIPSSSKGVGAALQALAILLGVGLIAVAARDFARLVQPAKATDTDALKRTSIPMAIAAAVDFKARERPLKIRPLPGLEDVVSDGQAVDALCASLPEWNPPIVALLLHELRLWGPAASFSDRVLDKPWSGDATVRILLNDKLCREQTATDGGSYLLDSPFGIRVVTRGSADALGTRGEGHHGQLLKVLGDAGLPLSTPLVTESGRIGTIADLLRDAAMRFTLDGELEFMAIALALWLPPERGWTDRFGAMHSFDGLIDALLSEPYGKGACGGCHKPYAITLILRCHEQCPVLSEPSRRKALQWLARLSKLLERSQCPDGGWDLSWPGISDSDMIAGDDILDRVTVVGHHLEWIALAPSRVRPGRETVKRAVAALSADIKAVQERRARSFKSLLPCSHAARALCLLRGEDPYRRNRSRILMDVLVNGRAERDNRGSEGLVAPQRGGV